MIHGMGGLTYMPHPLEPSPVKLRAERIVELAERIDIIETYNAWCEPAANQAAARLTEELGKVAATGSDSHAAHELGRSWMEIEPYTGPEDFLEKLRQARHVVTRLSAITVPAAVPDQRHLLVAGSVALDTRDESFWQSRRDARRIRRLLCSRGEPDRPGQGGCSGRRGRAKRVAQAFSGRPIDIEELQIPRCPDLSLARTSRAWRNIDLGNSDNIYDSWAPVLARGFEGWALSARCGQTARRRPMAMLGAAELLAADAMLSYVQARPPEARDVLRRAAWYFCNQEEFAARRG